MKEEITIRINNVDYKLKQSFRALMLVEKHIGKSVFAMDESLNNTVILFYYILQANNKNTFKFTLDEFIDLLDETPEAIEVFTEYLQAQQQPEDKKKAAKK